MKRQCPFSLFLVLAIAASQVHAAEPATVLVDSITLGQPASENAHALASEFSQIIPGALDQPARQLLPRSPITEYGGGIHFTMRCDPAKPNYVTVKLWGGDFNAVGGRLLLFVNDKQLGVRHLGDVDILDILGDAPRFPGRFFYKTLPLPRDMTKGADSVHLEIRGLGEIWGYGDTWDRFQKKMTTPSRGIYAVYTHTDPFFVPPPDEKQGTAPENPSARTQPGPEILDQLKTRVNGEVQKLLASSKPLNQMEMLLLARSYHVQWTAAYHSPKAIAQLIKSLDALYLAYLAKPQLAQSDPVTPNPDWFGLGPTGGVISLLADPLQPYLNQAVAGAPGTPRRAAWSQMMEACRDWHQRHRRLYTNQSMITDLYGIYLPNRALEVVDPAKALPEPQIRHYFYQSVGLEPWLGSETDHGPDKPVGDHYMELTDKGLTRELGYVGSYGEVLDWVTSIYNATRPAVGQPGDPKIEAQLVKIAKARAAFREPLVDEGGHRAMVLETVVGWRDNHYPGDITYGQRTTWDAGALDTAAATLDPSLVGYAQQMLDDNQFFAAVQERMKDKGLRVTAGLLETPDAYELIRAQPRSGIRLPMTPGQKDFVFSDEEDGVVALKHGHDILYASLYSRARFAVNFLARIHDVTPVLERDATAWETIQFDDSGLKYTIDDRIVEAQTRRHEKSRGNVQQALEGEVLPIAKVPPGTRYKPGDENVYAGKGTFYTLRYGPYLIAMNMTSDRTFELPPPAADRGIRDADELVSQKKVSLAAPLRVGPRSTVILYLPSPEPAAAQ